MRKIRHLLENTPFLNHLRRKETKNSLIENELIHPRFGLTPKDINGNKKAKSTLLFLMYSKENEALFI